MKAYLLEISHAFYWKRAKVFYNDSAINVVIQAQRM